MSQTSDIEIHEIVQRVIKRMQGIESAEGKVSLSPLSSQSSSDQYPTQKQEPPKTEPKIVAIGADHGGFEMKAELKPYLVELGYKVIDCGTNDKNSVDYPDFAYAVAQLVAEGKANCGIVIDGAGIGSCMAANKVNGVRAAMCYDYATAVNSREHNNANVLTLGAGMIGMNLAKLIVKTWLGTEFAGGRHIRRIEKIIAIEKKYLKG